jgi:glycosyltransferase involved in cell wall biosynthesis
MQSATRYLVMLGTDFSSPGGITAVIRKYREAGLFGRWPVRFLPTYHRAGAVNKIVSANRALMRFLFWLARGEVGWVHAHVAARGSFWRKSLFLVLARLGHARTVFHLHDGSFPAWYAARGKSVQRLVRAMLRGVDRVIVLTPKWADWVRSIEPAASIVVVGNPVSVPDAVSARLPGRVLFLGRLWEEKGIFDLLEAAAGLRDSVPELMLVCAGDGDFAAVQARAAALGLADCLQLPGWVEDEDKATLLREAAVFVLPSYFEGLPMGVLEAMAYAVPVVATEVGGMRDAVGASAGVLVPPHDPAVLQEALARVLNDADLQLQMGEAGRQRVLSEFEAGQVVAQLGAVYASLGLRECAERPAGSVQTPAQGDD